MQCNAAAMSPPSMLVAVDSLSWRSPLSVEVLLSMSGVEKHRLGTAKQTHTQCDRSKQLPRRADADEVDTKGVEKHREVAKTNITS